MKWYRVLAFWRWFDAYAAGSENPQAIPQGQVDWVRVIPYLLMHLGCLLVLWVGTSPVALIAAVALYGIRMFAITGWYHRYFSHRTFKTSRWLQFAFAVLGNASAQRGPLWWAAHHRQHHRRADQPGDPHSPIQRGFLWSHTLWFLTPENFGTESRRVKDFARFPELVFLDRFDALVPLALAGGLFFLGLALEQFVPSWHTTGPQMLVWGFFVSTVMLYHATFCINSMAHVWGTRRYQTPDQSRNNPWLSLLTLGEGWHNNHHHYPWTVRQGFFWYEFDPTYWVLKVMSWTGLIWDLRPVSNAIREDRNRENAPYKMAASG